MDVAVQPEPGDHRYVIGIDLGTTNSAVAHVDLASRRQHEASCPILTLAVPQLVATGEVARQPVLPSFLYLPGSYDLPPGSTALPWDPERNYIVGEFAREQGTLVPGRLVSSAKSWLCHGGVSRTDPILPWGAEQEVPRLSPVEASARYLLHIREAWNDLIARGRDGHRLEEQLVILTVPASFDEVARELTVRAAREAGIPRVILLEEPLAAFYAWLSHHESDWQHEMRAGQLILICDVGGGTSDFTILAVREGEKGLRFDRLAVGDHLMLGGDNMDLTLGRHLEARLLGKAGSLEANRWRQLFHQCRKVKETLLGDAEADAAAEITVLGSGAKLIADVLKTTVTRREVEQLIVEGFFPFVSPGETPRDERRTGLTELGLPYVQDPAITRHLSAFWQRFQILLHEETGRAKLYPDFLLCNGGALSPTSIRDRLHQVVAGWFQDSASENWAPTELDSPSLELAVAQGAAYYGLVRLGRGVRVGAGSPRAYYAEVGTREKEQHRDAVSGVCLVPRGAEEGFEAQLGQHSFEVLTNEPVVFQLMSSSTRLGDRLGDAVQLRENEISVSPPIRTVLRYGRKRTARKMPVEIAVRLTEVGTLDLWCQSLQSPHRWQLQFDVRQQVEPSSVSGTAAETLDLGLVEKAQDKIHATFQAGASSKDNPPEHLARELSGLLDMSRERWPVPVIRKLADTLLKLQEGRTLTAQHEARWLNLLGFCMRPGFGNPLDEWRMKEIWKAYLRGLHFPRQAPCRSELWIFLRRVGGGLAGGQQWHIYQQVSSHIQTPGAKRKKADSQSPKRLAEQEELEVWLALANFERLPAETKADLGRLLLQRLQRTGRPQELWALSRFGARIPLYGPLDLVIPPGEAASWLNFLISSNLRPGEAMAHTLVQLARSTGDRARDVPDAERRKVAKWLERIPQSDRFREMLSSPETAWQRREQDVVFGESLPAGLVLSATSQEAAP